MSSFFRYALKLPRTSDPRHETFLSENFICQIWSDITMSVNWVQIVDYFFNNRSVEILAICLEEYHSTSRNLEQSLLFCNFLTHETYVANPDQVVNHFKLRNIFSTKVWFKHNFVSWIRICLDPEFFILNVKGRGPLSKDIYLGCYEWDWHFIQRIC